MGKPITWYGRSRERAYTAFYCYKRKSRELVKITLTLNGGSFAYYFRDQYVGFSEERVDPYFINRLDNGTIMKPASGPMCDKPRAANYAYHLTSVDGVRPIGDACYGGFVVDERNAYLPGGLTNEDLVNLADVCFEKQLSIRLTKNDDYEESHLAMVIRGVIGHVPGTRGLLFFDADEREIDPVAVVRSPRRRRRGYRCTII